MAQLQTSEYKALEQRISNVSLDIASQEVLLRNRLESTYHSQWEAGQDTAENLKGLRESLAVLLGNRTLVGQQAAIREVATTQFFQQIGGSVHVETNTVRLIGYGVLSLLLELSTLGMISLAQLIKQENNQSLQPATTDSLSPSILKREVNLSVVTLVSDIMTGKIPPVLRKIQSANYGIEIDITRNLLKELLQAGIIKKDKRNSYKLSR
ncbi:MAG: hypothetical protein COA78_24195 [Blastopirellula sp.]|nr:MAG: hypothetical protein COA78_24195 [Blastopirellula sp.]